MTYLKTTTTNKNDKNLNDIIKALTKTNMEAENIK